MFKTIIFDLGGILINIDYQRCVASFEKLNIFDFSKQFTQAAQSDFMDLFETGHKSENEFREWVNTFTPNKLTDQEIDTAWNSILLDFPKWKLELLQKVKQHYKVILFSNTNAIHVKGFLEIFEKSYPTVQFFDLFDQVYLSNEVGFRKPHAESFELILKKEGISAEETVFMDDTQRHVEGAKKAGINAFWLPEGDISAVFDQKGFVQGDIEQ